MLIEKDHGVDQGQGRDSYGHFAYGQESKPWVDKEKRGLDEVEEEESVTVIRDQVRSTLSGSTQHRYFDGFIQRPDGTYSAVEVKSGTAIDKHLRNEKNQLGFDEAITPENPATAILRGEQISITKVILKVMP